MRYNLTGKIGESYETLLKDESFFRVHDEVALLRTALDQCINVCQHIEKESGQFPAPQFAQMTQSLVRDIITAVKTCAELEERLGHQVPVESFKIVLQELSGVIKKEVKDPIALQRIAQGFRELPWSRAIASNGRKPRPRLGRPENGEVKNGESF